MKKLNFAIIIVLVIMSILLVACSNEKADDYIPAGYISTDGNTDYGKDLTESFYYEYDSMPTLNEEYTVVSDENRQSIIDAINICYGNFNETRNSELANQVSNGDYYILTAYNNDGSEKEFNSNEQFEDTNFKLYFFDTENNTLHYIYCVW
ncbi:MAG: hypothetical protein ACI4XC_08915 [Eubacterium sp.]